MQTFCNSRASKVSNENFYLKIVEKIFSAYNMRQKDFKKSLKKFHLHQIIPPCIKLQAKWTVCRIYNAAAAAKNFLEELIDEKMSTITRLFGELISEKSIALAYFSIVILLHATLIKHCSSYSRYSNLLGSRVFQ